MSYRTNNSTATIGSTAGPTGSPRAPIRTMVVICVPMFLVLLDVNIVHVALPHIGSGFGIPVGAWSWVVDCYTLPLAATLLVGGRLTDRLGYRAMLALGVAVFLTGSLGCTLAPSWAVLLVSRSLQGLGAAAMLPAGLAALTSLWRDDAARAKAFGVWSSTSAAATALGSAIGGLLIAGAGWRSVFAINIPLCVIALLGITRLERAPTRTGSGAASGRRRPPVRQLAGATSAAFLMTAVGNGVLLAVTVHTQRALGFSAVRTGLFMLIATVPFVALGPVTGRLMRRFGRRAMACTGFTAGATLLLALTRAGTDGDVVWIGLGLLGLGTGLGFMTASIVGEGMEALPGSPGLAGGLNNTARQLGTSFGVAASAAVLGSHTRLVSGLQQVGLLAVGVWLLGALVAAVFFARAGGSHYTAQRNFE